jgi:hypothetical protein
VPAFEVTRHTQLDADDAWGRLTDWERHGDFLPFTTIALSGVIRDDIGAGFVARTAIGPFHFDDPMDITKWQPPLWERPGVCEIRKRGGVVAGWAILTVAKADEGSMVSWHEDARFRLAGPLLDVPTRVVGQRIFGRVIDGLLSDS